MEIMRCYFVLVLVLVLVIITSCQHSSVDVLVDTPTGVIRGHVLETWTKNKYYAFKGIPYAEPPIGKLRFKAPVRVKSWEGIKDATKDGKICPQADPKFVGGTVNEDCLYLNVYSKNLLGSLPVIVFIHPGGFRFMTGASTWYGPDYLLDHDIVFVTFNYRLDALGFLSTGDKLATGNFGMKDQVEVLKWVQKNIIHFGGNPHQVTITGDSSGAASVFLHMLSPMSRGLFHKAVAMSGGIVGTIKWLTSKQQIVITEKLAKDFNCPIKPANDMVECLRNIPADEINSKFRETEELGPRVALNFGPVIESEGVDGEERFLLDHPSTLFKNKLFNHVPVVTGITEYELVRKAVGIAKNKTCRKIK
ncbi:esterase E4-like [Lycorma delicatula]|uniref:esterase E4-like n=1 Tax=Lycorma delicatula TaxID=130591 RepID=UPI003F5128AA